LLGGDAAPRGRFVDKAIGLRPLACGDASGSIPINAPDSHGLREGVGGPGGRLGGGASGMGVSWTRDGFASKRL